MTTKPLTPEQLAELRDGASKCYPLSFDMVLRLLDALEAERARADAAETQLASERKAFMDANWHERLAAAETEAKRLRRELQVIACLAHNEDQTGPACDHRFEAIEELADAALSSLPKPEGEVKP
jgi:hypothetical protein